jgi:hypothetical protein
MIMRAISKTFAIAFVFSCNFNFAEEGNKVDQTVRCIESIRFSLVASQAFDGKDRQNWLSNVYLQMLHLETWMKTNRHSILKPNTHAEHHAVSKFLLDFRDVSGGLVDAFGVTRDLSDEEIDRLDKNLDSLKQMMKKLTAQK